MKKILSFMLIFCMIISLVPVIPITVYAETNGPYTYTITNGEVTITDCVTDICGDVVIPSQLMGYPVTTIGPLAFESCSYITSLTIPGSVKSIGDGAFQGLKAETIIIADSITTIPPAAFYDSKIVNLYVGRGLQTIGANAFYSCSALENVYYGGTEEEWKTITIERNNNDLINATKVYGAVVPTEMPTANPDAPQTEFPYVEGALNENITWKISMDKVLTISGTGEIPDYEYLGSYPNKYTSPFYRYRSEISSVVIEGGITSIGAYTFPYIEMTSVSLPDTLTTLGTNAFSHCFFSSLTIPGSVKNVSYFSIDNCTNLSSVVIEKGTEIIERWAFGGCSNLCDVTIPNSVKTIGEMGFGYSPLETVYFYGTESEWEDIEIHQENDALNGATKIYLGDQPTEAPTEAPTEEPTETPTETPTEVPTEEPTEAPTETPTEVPTEEPTEVPTEEPTEVPTEEPTEVPTEEPTEMPNIVVNGMCGEKISWELRNGILTICGQGSMDNYPSKEAPWENYKNLIYKIAVESGVENVGSHAFLSMENLKSVVLGDTVTVIGWSAFSGCPNLEDVQLGNGIRVIDRYAFYRCQSLTTILLPDSLEIIGDGAFEQTGLLKIDVPENATKIGTNAFYRCENLADIELPDCPISIAYWPFLRTQYAENEENWQDGILYIGKHLVAVNHSVSGTVVIKEGTRSIASGAFDDCEEVTCVKIPDSVEIIGEAAFYGCTGLISVMLPANLKKISDQTFIGCEQLKSVVIPEGVTEIGKDAFAYCFGLESVTIPDSVKTIGDSAFLNCSSLFDISIGEGLETIGPFAFAYAFQLNNTAGEYWTLKLPNSVTTIGESAFANSKFLFIELGDGVTSLGAQAFENSYLAEIKMPEKLQTIEEGTFAGCLIDTIAIPETVTAIGSRAFDNSYMKSVFIPESVVSLEVDSFSLNTTLCVYEDSYAHNFAVENNLPFFIMHKDENPEVCYGTDISGIVTDANGNPVENAVVELLDYEGVVRETVNTLSDGSYTFTYVEIGEYTICAKDEAGNTTSEAISVKRMNEIDVVVTGTTAIILKRGYTVTGSLSTNDATVLLTDLTGNVIATTIASDGTYSFMNIPNGTYLIKAQNEGGSITKEIHIYGADVTIEELAILTDLATVKGNVEVENRDYTHSKKRWVNVSIYNEEGNAVAQTKTDEEGEYAFHNIPIGNYAIVAEVEAMRPDMEKQFERSHLLTGYGYINVTQNQVYVVETIVLYEENNTLTSISGKVTAQGETQNCEVILSNVFRHEIARQTTKKNGKYSFKNIPDGLYFITAVTPSDGMGFAVITIKEGVVYGSTDLKVSKEQWIEEHETNMRQIPVCENYDEANLYREEIAAEKEFYDSLPEKEKKQFSKEYQERLNTLCELIGKCSYETPEGVKVHGGGTVVSGDELRGGETFTFELSVKKVEEESISNNGIKNDSQYQQQMIYNIAGEKKIVEQYDISLSKNSKDISNVSKDTDTTGKIRVTMDIPEEYRGYKHYTMVHMHNGVPTTLVDLDDNPDTITFEIDRFSTFALTCSNVELTEETTDDSASITYDAQSGKIKVSSSEDGMLYIGTYNGNQLTDFVSYTIVAGAVDETYDFNAQQAAFVWNNQMNPLCEKFVISE